MLLQEISDEYLKLGNVVQEIGSILTHGMQSIYTAENERFTIYSMIGYMNDIRKIVRIQTILENERFKSKIVRGHAKNFIGLVEIFCVHYDLLAEYLSDEQKSSGKKDLLFLINQLREDAKNLYEWFRQISFAVDTLIEAAKETWEPLPNDLKVDCENVAISSETKGITLSDVSKDIESLNNFLNNICILINKDKENNYFLRKVETGSLSVIISCATSTAPIIAFIFFVIELCQNTEKRTLNNKDKRLELINKHLDMAKKILDIDPKNTETDEIIQKCGLYLLQYFENNSSGTINGERYDIGTEILKIEERREE